MEGEIGLMPPLQALSDDEIAAVLTYVRREWNNVGTPVDPGEVAEIRGLSALRDRPWTREELATATGRR
jgi:mono/diheme cytochrome c family protein